MSGPDLKVLFIGGYERSGSTLLQRVLGQVHGFVACGEVRYVWGYGILENRRCGCGKAFRECPFWSDVIQEAFDPSGVDLRSVRDLRARVDRWWRVPQLWSSGLRSAAYRSDLEDYLAVLDSLFRAIQRVSGADVIVDASKTVSHGFVLQNMPGMKLFVVHLVRDSRAVAHSLRRRKYDEGRRRYVQRAGWMRTSLEWMASNLLLSPLARRAPYLLLRYEDFARHPGDEVEALLSFVDEADRQLPISPSGTSQLEIQHGIAGNPDRFRREPLAIRLDDEWRSRMSGVDRALVSLVTSPLLLRYGFLRDPP